MSNNLKIIALREEAFSTIEQCVNTNDFSLIDEVVEKFRLDQSSAFSDKKDQLLINSSHELFLLLNDDVDYSSVKVLEGIPFIEDEFHFRYLKNNDAKTAFESFQKQDFIDPDIFINRYRNKVVMYEEDVRSVIDQFLPDHAHTLIEKTKITMSAFHDSDANHFDITGKHLAMTTDIYAFYRILYCYEAIKAIGDYYIQILTKRNVWFFIY